MYEFTHFFELINALLGGKIVLLCMNRFKDYFTLHLLVFIWGFTAILGVLISLPAPVMVVYRTGLAAVGLAVLMFLQGQNVLTPRFWPLLLTGALVSLHWMLFFGSARVSNVSISLAGLSTQALFTSFLEPIFNKKRINLLEVALGLVVMLGLYLIFKFEFQYSLGLWMSIGCSFVAAIFSVLNGKFANQYEAEHVAFYEMVGATLASLLYLPLFIWAFGSENFTYIPQPLDWLWLLILAIVCTVYPFTASVKLMKKISVFLLNLTLNLEPVYGIILAFLIFGKKEQMTPGFYAGGLIILAAVVAYPILKKKDL